MGQEPYREYRDKKWDKEQVLFLVHLLFTLQSVSGRRELAGRLLGLPWCLNDLGLWLVWCLGTRKWKADTEDIRRGVRPVG